jgi:hypothetical protein
MAQLYPDISLALSALSFLVMTNYTYAVTRLRLSFFTLLSSFETFDRLTKRGKIVMSGEATTTW